MNSVAYLVILVDMAIHYSLRITNVVFVGFAVELLKCMGFVIMVSLVG
jgi:hypothetical protein